MSAQAQAVPPKLQQLLETLPDVDKVKLLAIAHHYKMDLDDPGFLPLLLTQQGISALDKAKAEMVLEVEKTLDLLAERMAVAGQHEEKRLGMYTDRLAGYMKQRAAEAEAGMKQALAAWAERALSEALDKAIASRADAATATAVATTRRAAETFVEASGTAAAKAQQAAAAAIAAAHEAREAASRLETAWLWAAFLGGGLTWAVALEAVKRIF